MKDKNTKIIVPIMLLVLALGLFYGFKTYRDSNPKLGDFWEDSNPEDYETAKEPEKEEREEYIADADGRQYQYREVPSMGYGTYFPVKWEHENIGDTLYVKENDNDTTPIELSFTRLNNVPTTQENIMTKVDDFLFTHFTYNHPTGEYNFLQSYYLDPVSMYDKDVKVWVNQDEYNYLSYPIDQKPEGVSVKEDYKLIGFKHSQENKLHKNKSAMNTMEAYTAFYFIPVDMTSVIMVTATAPASRKDDIETIIDTVAIKSETLDWVAYSESLPAFNKKEKVGNFSFYVDGDLNEKLRGGAYYAKFDDDPSSPLYTSTLSVRKISHRIDDKSMMDPRNNVKIKTIPFADKSTSPHYIMNQLGDDFGTNISELKKEELNFHGRDALYIVYKGNYKGFESPHSQLRFPKPLYGQMFIIKDGKDIYIVNATYPMVQANYFKNYIQSMLKNAVLN